MIESNRNTQFDILKSRMRTFLLEREWIHFHSPKNIAMSLSIESAELMELFQWSNPSTQEIKENPSLFNQVVDELADIQIYLTSFALALDIDLFSYTTKKMDKNNQRFPPKKT